MREVRDCPQSPSNGMTRTIYIMKDAVGQACVCARACVVWTHECVTVLARPTPPNPSTPLPPPSPLHHHHRCHLSFLRFHLMPMPLLLLLLGNITTMQWAERWSLDHISYRPLTRSPDLGRKDQGKAHAELSSLSCSRCFCGGTEMACSDTQLHGLIAAAIVGPTWQRRG